jgi:ABC-type transport system involved in multi-copper enzyme maturation permease subunit
MTTTAPTAPPPEGSVRPGRGVSPSGTAVSRLARARDALAFEWTKLQSVRSNRWTLIAAVLVTLGITVVVAESLVAAPATRPAPFDTLTASFLGYAEYTVLPVTVLSVLVFTSEYASGLIRTTFTAVPRRGSVLAAKAAVTGAAALVVGELLAVTCFLLTQAIATGRHGGLSLAHPGVPRAILAVGLALAACAMVGVAAGAITRHTAGGIAAALTVVYLLAVLCMFLPGPWNTRLGRFTMPYAAYQAVSLHPQASLLSPGLSLLVIIAWPAIALLAAAAVLARRDV